MSDFRRFACVRRVVRNVLNIVLVAPEIPPNTGNAMRLAANTGARLHLVRPLGFTLETKALRRAGLDYRDSADVTVHDRLDICLSGLLDAASGATIRAISTRGGQRHDQVNWQPDDIAVFGSESAGLPADFLDDPCVDAVVRLPMRAGMRSLNLSNAVAIVAFEAWRQQDFVGASGID